MSGEMAGAAAWRGRSVRALRRSAPLREFLQTESGSSGILVTMVVAALIWANVDDVSYESLWHLRFSLRLGDIDISQDLRTWVNNGLMTFFFLVVGLEARREFDLGDLRERRRFIFPFVSGILAMAVPVLIYLLFNAGRSSIHGWGVAMSTDTALALGLLALLGRQVPERVRLFLLTVFVVDDLAALIVIAVFYSERISPVPLFFAGLAFAALAAVTLSGVRRRRVYSGIGVLLWALLLASGVDPVVAGLVTGLAAPAYSPTRTELEQATSQVRLFREQPTAELARSARTELTATISPNARLQLAYHRWTSYLIVPAFALANAGIPLGPSFISHASRSPITLGVLIGYVLGKPLAIIAASWLLSTLSRGKVRAPVGWAAVIGSGTIAGIGFTVALLIATRAFSGEDLADAKLGALSAATVSALLTWVVYRMVSFLPSARKARALLGDSTFIQDLVPKVDADRDHVRGPANASVTLIEFGDFQCPYCGQAEAVVRELLHDEHLRYVWRHLPLADVHPRAQLAAEATEAAGVQGAFWRMHDLLFAHQDREEPVDLLAYAHQLGLDTDRFSDELRRGVHTARVASDIESADLSGVSGTPTFFINGQRHYGAYDLATLTRAIKIERARLNQT